MDKKKLFIASILLFIIMTIRFSSIGEWINLCQLKISRHYLQQLVHDHYTVAVFCYIGLYILITAFSVPVGALLTIAGGLLFGVVAGVCYTNIGATLGATISFLLVRYFVGIMIQQKYAVQLTQFNDAIKVYGPYYLLFVRFVVIVPFFLVNILAGLTNVSLWTFVWTTAIGVLPGSLVYAFAGQQLNEIESVRDIFSLRIIFAFSLLALFTIVPLLLLYLRRKHKSN